MSNLYKKTFLNGLIYENPTFVQLLGMCPTLAVTTSCINALGMGLSTMFVLIFSNIVISLVRNYIPSKIRIASYIVIIATFVTIIDMLLKAYIPSLSKALGLYIPLIVVNCIILARAESFASKNKPLPSAVDGLGMGLGFTLGLTVLGFVRELLGNGTIFGMNVFSENFKPATMFILPPGAFIALGIILAVVGVIRKKYNGGSADE